jgi:tetratricopeptide (TPR) repeat protein
MMYVVTLFGRHKAGDRLAARIVGVYRRTQHPKRYAEASYIVALSLMLQARWDECEKKAVEAEAIANAMDEAALSLAILAVRANAAELRGDYAQCRELSVVLRNRAYATADKLKLCWAFGCLGIIALRKGEYDEAIESAQASLSVADSIGESATAFAMAGTLTLALWRNGNADEARAMAESCVARLQKISRISTAHHLLVGLEMVSEAVLAMWESDAAPRNSPQWRADAKRAATVLARLRLHGSLLPIGATLVASRQASWHWLQGGHERAIRGWRRAIALADAAGIPYASATAHLELARHAMPAAEGADHLRIAGEIFGRLGTKRNLSSL